MASKYYNIILIIVLISIILFMFLTNNKCNLSPQPYPILEGARTLIPTEYVQKNQALLFDKPMELKKHWAITFTMRLNKGYTGNWQQIIGISPYKDGEGRIFGAWICPSSNTVHFRTATKASNGYVNGNDAILGGLDCGLGVGINEYIRFDIISNNNGDGTQTLLTYMQNRTKGENTPKLVQQPIILSEGYYSPKNGFNEAWMFTSYIPWYKGPENIIDGTLSDVVFVSGDTKMTIDNLQNATNYAEGVSTTENNCKNKGYLPGDPRCQAFTTMEDAIYEGYTNIGGIGNNGGVIGLSPPTASISAVGDPDNYIPIKDKLNLKSYCARSVVQPTDKNINLSNLDGKYNYKVNLGSDSYPGSGNNNEGTVPICNPDDLYMIQMRILDKINDFNSDYSDFMTYKYNSKHSANGDDTPKLKYVTKDRTDGSASVTFTGKNKVSDLDTYKDVMQSIHTYNNLIKANAAYYHDPENTPKQDNNPTDPLSKIDPVELNKKHSKIVKFRNDLDKKLFELNNIQNSAEGESKMQVDSNIYINILWTTLATCVIYFMFV